MTLKDKNWKLVEQRSDGEAWVNKSLGLVVISSMAKELDGKFWQHVSLSRKSKVPSYDDMCLVKKLFIGEDKKAIQIFAQKSDHVNIHPYCLHLWHCIDGDSLPDFTHGKGSI